MDRSADAPTPLPQPRITLGPTAIRPTLEADCDFVLAAESHPDNAGFVEQWSHSRHRQTMLGTDSLHWIIESHRQPIGYAILEDADDPNHSLLLRRVVIASKGRGHGRTALVLLMHYCFEVLGFHRLWLFVAVANRRAVSLYRRLGFVEEGVARECSRHEDRYSSMYIMSMLEPEYRDRPPAAAKCAPHQTRP
ncbi:MAG: GNAT family protein [Salinisphaera sp.]|uniref:GNAT family N-acetyltransferase n=1 Tax=Salinisphaera sp. TaxID=1914330 RepID=UPI003C7BDBC2